MAHLTPFKILGSLKMFVSFTCEQGSFHHAWFVKGSPTTSTSLNSDLPVLPSASPAFPRPWSHIGSPWALGVGRSGGPSEKQATYVQWRLEIWSQMRFFCVCVLFRWWFQTWKKMVRKEGREECWFKGFMAGSTWKCEEMMPLMGHSWLRGIVLDVFSNILSSSNCEKTWGILAKWLLFFSPAIMEVENNHFGD